MTDGVRGIAAFVAKYIMKCDDTLQYVCKDFARQIFYYKDANGLDKIDYNAKDLIDLLRPDFKNRLVELKGLFEDKIVDMKKYESYRSLDITEVRQLDFLDLLVSEAIKLSFEIMNMRDNNKFSIELAKLTKK